MHYHFKKGNVDGRAFDPPQGLIQVKVMLPNDVAVVVGLPIPDTQFSPSGFTTSIRVDATMPGGTEFMEVTIEEPGPLTPGQMDVLREGLAPLRQTLNGSRWRGTQDCGQGFFDLVAPVLEKLLEVSLN